ncbi:hypothetical protein ADUPG1_005946 [Aduncisulcus paluster]|uniref:Protein kinase domain-containing protein n=1 Tax=Aduncisulcus paluster TaxID=2918883 RepID=A0ABQ5KG88_9EUKA|nr:hypothetical protein ADUPG1_005946 [Aduncisulcus paluster]
MQSVGISKMIGRLVIGWRDIKIVKVLCKGGQGVVYKAKYNGLDVCVKMIETSKFGGRSPPNEKALQQLISDFECEFANLLSLYLNPISQSFIPRPIKILNTLDHKSLEKRTYGFIMELFECDAVELSIRFADNVVILLKLCLGMARALNAIHIAEKNLIHGDVKPENFLIRVKRNKQGNIDWSDFDVAISDFGMSSDLDTIHTIEDTSDLPTILDSNSLKDSTSTLPSSHSSGSSYSTSTKSSTKPSPTSSRSPSPSSNSRSFSLSILKQEPHNVIKKRTKRHHSEASKHDHHHSTPSGEDRMCPEDPSIQPHLSTRDPSSFRLDSDRPVKPSSSPKTDSGTSDPSASKDPSLTEETLDHSKTYSYSVCSESELYECGDVTVIEQMSGFDVDATNTSETIEKKQESSAQIITDSQRSSKQIQSASTSTPSEAPKRKQRFGLTVVYASPEVLRSRTPTRSGDAFSLGLSIWAILTGSAPFLKHPEVVKILRKKKGKPQGNTSHMLLNCVSRLHERGECPTLEGVALLDNLDKESYNSLIEIFNGLTHSDTRLRMSVYDASIRLHKLVTTCSTSSSLHFELQTRIAGHSQTDTELSHTPHGIDIISSDHPSSVQDLSFNDSLVGALGSGPIASASSTSKGMDEVIAHGMAGACLNALDKVLPLQLSKSDTRESEREFGVRPRAHSKKLKSDRSEKSFSGSGNLTSSGASVSSVTSSGSSASSSNAASFNKEIISFLAKIPAQYREDPHASLTSTSTAIRKLAKNVVEFSADEIQGNAILNKLFVLPMTQSVMFEAAKATMLAKVVRVCGVMFEAAKATMLAKVVRVCGFAGEEFVQRASRMIDHLVTFAATTTTHSKELDVLSVGVIEVVAVCIDFSLTPIQVYNYLRVLVRLCSNILVCPIVANSGVPAILNVTTKRYMQDEGVALSSCQILEELSRHELARRPMYNAEAVPFLLSCGNRWVKKSEIVCTVCNTLFSIGMLGDTRIGLAEVGTGRFIQRLLAQHHEPQVLRAAVSVAVVLTMEPTARPALYSSGLLSSVAGVGRRMRHNAEVCIEVLSAVYNFCLNPDTLRHVLADGTIRFVLTVAKKWNDNPKIVKLATDIVAVMTSLTEALPFLHECGVVSMLSRTLHTYIKVKEIAMVAMSCVANLGAYTDIRGVLYNEGLGTLLLNAVSIHIRIPEALCAALRGLWSMAGAGINRGPLLADGMADKLVEVLREHYQNPFVCKDACLCVWNLGAAAENRQRLGDLKLHRHLLRVVDVYHHSNPDVTVSALSAIYTIGACAGNRTLLHEGGTGESMINLLSTHIELHTLPVVRESMRVLWTVTAARSTRIELCEKGGVRCVCNVLRRQSDDRESVLESVRVLWNFTVEKETHETCQVEGVVKAVMYCVVHYEKDKEMILDVLALLLNIVSTEAFVIADDGICSFIVRILKQHPHEQQILRRGCKLMVRMCSHPPNRVSCISLGACAPLATVVENFLSNQLVSTVAVSALSFLAAVRGSRRQLVQEFNVHMAVVLVARTHASPRVAKECLAVLYQLAGDTANAQDLIAVCVPSMVRILVQRHPEDEDIKLLGRRVLKRIFPDRHQRAQLLDDAVFASLFDTGRRRE